MSLVAARLAQPQPSRPRRARFARGRADRLRRVLLAGAAAASLLLGAAPSAEALISPAVTIDGPSAAIVGFGGVAMAEDGTGGVVYLKKVEGVVHVFVSQYYEGKWSKPIRVDAEDKYGASWPRIGASEGGGLIVTWATPYATENEKPVYEMLGATMDPGATGFGQAQIIDPDIGSAVGTDPDLSVSTTDFADLVYRVVEEPGAGSRVDILRPGDVVATIRVAHYKGRSWTDLGTINRDTSLSMRPPSAENAPQVVVNQWDNGIVVWQEPEVTGQALIWARRIFGESVGYPMLVSASEYAGKALNGDDVAPTVAYSRLSQAFVAYRQEVGSGSPFAGPRIFTNTLADGESSTPGLEFEGAQLADDNVSGGASATVGAPSVDLDENNEYRLFYDANGAARQFHGFEFGSPEEQTLTPPFAGSEHAAVTAIDPEGGGFSAWPSTEALGHPAVAIHEEYPEGGVQNGLVGGGEGGEVENVSIGRSGLGDGIVAFRQGPLGAAAIVASVVSEPPGQFVVSVAPKWVRPTEALVEWTPAPSADGPVTYAVFLDGHEQPTPPRALKLQLNPALLAPGVHHIQVRATDRYGEEHYTPPVELLIGGPPQITVSHRGAKVSIKVTDPHDNSPPGLRQSSLHIAFGDGHRAASARTTHRYARRGLYWVSAEATSSLGMHAHVRIPVRIP
ncbi:MAG TPA: hypothetical protein VMA83_07180 [Solirubrobacteraceae bacterium]|nr:hypothetical protein [Solirubrobacteraceae bacterium]